MKEYKLTDTGALSSWNITEEDKAKGSKIVTRGKWGDGSEEFPLVGTRYTYEVLVYGNVDDIENKFPDSAEPEEPGDPDADTPVPVDASGLIPDSILNDTVSQLQGIGSTSAFTSAASTLGGLQNKLQNINPTEINDAMAELEELIKQAEIALGDRDG